MNVDGETIPLYGLGLVLLIIFVILAAIYLMVGYWQRKIPQSIKKFPQLFHNLQLENKRLLAITRNYSAEDPPPYGGLMKGIDQQLDEAALQLVEIKNHYVSIQDFIHHITFRSWKFLVGAPFTFLSWYGLYKEIGSIQKEAETIELSFESIQRKIYDLEKQAWLVALRARQAIESEKGIRHLMEYFDKQGLHGDAMEIAKYQEEQVIEGLEKIPRNFYISDETVLSNQVHKEDICLSYALLDDIEPTLNELSLQLSIWVNRFKSLEEKVNRLFNQLDRVEQFLNSEPPYLDISKEKSQVEILKITLMVMSDTLSRLEVESIDIFEDELEKQISMVSELSGGVRKGFRQKIKLMSLLDDLERYQRECSDEITHLAKNQRYPILWDKSQSQFMSINKSISDLGSPKRNRTLEEVLNDLVIADKLTQQMILLKAHLISLRSKHNHLLNMMDGEERQMGSEWLEKYKELGSQVAEFHPNNWHRSYAVGEYMTDVLNLQSRHESTLMRDPTQPIPESQIDDIILRCESVIKDHEQMQLRSEKIQARLQWLKNTDASTREQYQSLRSAIIQMSWIVNSNSFLKQIAEPELSNIRREIERYGSDLIQPQIGIIEQKTTAINKTLDDTLIKGNRWLDRLNQEISMRSDALAVSIERIHQIASLDDPAIIKAQRVLAREERWSSQTQSSSAFSFELDKLVSEIRVRSSVWQEFIAVQQEVEEIVAAPLQDAASNAEKQRNLVLAALEEADKKIPEQRAWPACSVILSDERRKMEELENKWKSMKSKPTRAIWAVRQYGELSAGYQEILGNITRARQWAAQEQKRILDLEAEIDRLNNYWRRQEKLIIQDPIAVEQIRRMRVHSSEEVSRIKHSWLSKSEDISTYDDVLQAMLENARALRSAVVTMKTVGGEPREIRFDRERYQE